LYCTALHCIVLQILVQLYNCTAKIWLEVDIVELRISNDVQVLFFIFVLLFLLRRRQGQGRDPFPRQLQEHGRIGKVRHKLLQLAVALVAVEKVLYAEYPGPVGVEEDELADAVDHGVLPRLRERVTEDEKLERGVEAGAGVAKSERRKASYHHTGYMHYFN
jgi:hypothetical protein